MQRLRMGIIGCASFAERVMIPAIQASGGFKLQVIASRSKAKAQEFATKASCEVAANYEAVLEDPNVDAVYIPLPNGLHEEWAARALQAGKHVLCEKALTCTVESTRRLVRIAREQRLVLFENFAFEYHPQMAFVQSTLNQNEIGELRLVRSTFGFPPFNDRRNIRYTKELGGGALLDAGVYTIRATSLFLSGKIEVVGARLTYPSGHEVDLYGAAMLVNPKGICSQISFGFDQFYQCTIELQGTIGKLTMHRAFTSGPSICPTIVIERDGERKEFSLPSANQFVLLLNAFAEAINKGDIEIKLSAIERQAELTARVQEMAKAL